MNKSAILSALRSFISQRPGLDFGNYCSGYRDESGRKAYNAEVRAIGRDLRDARALLREVELSSISGDDLVKASESAFSGRLKLTSEGESVRIEYCTGQYWPTEYRKAVAAVCARALWNHRGPDYPDGESLRAGFKRTFGRRMAGDWFN